ncbi:hygromycin-B 7''-O-kinase [Kibdelosporangium banguiense]|uniref:Hygromycin-B 7''-O-kinase n=1 Tax=Kibdelosporangium banguiense TaxID=1365924 RepID=A0ABS4TYZ3_9PSEU|nr:aminoglycoside 3'-phosphotransferase/choline kinase family protein [Kibdelosporangium banguiense]MBP2329610.1 hygromycin-B 7''-O-kinase [Kibdelosporangium banguiense]
MTSRPGDVRLPVVDTEERYEAVRRDEELLRPGVLGLAAALGFANDSVTRFADGSLPVYALGAGHVLKLYPHLYRHECDLETAALNAIADRLPIPTPRVHDAGPVPGDPGWQYLLMSRLPGESLATAWPRIDRATHLRLASELGEALAELHAITPSRQSPLPIPDWPTFLATQRVNCVAAQQELGLDPHWLGQLPAFLNAVDLPTTTTPVLLHTEVMRQHLLVTDGPAWSLSGLFDFEPAMFGAAEYEFVAVGLFGSMGDAELLRAVLTGYGYRPADLDHDLSRRLLGYTLIHQQCNLPWYLRAIPAPQASTMDELADQWFGV